MSETEATKVAIVTGAIQLSGEPNGSDDYRWRKRVEDNAALIASMTAPGHPVGRIIDQLSSSRILVGTLKAVKKPAAGDNSTRASVELETFVTKFTKDGIDRFRTDRTDTKAGMAQAKALAALKGRRVRVWIENEGKDESKGEKGFRVLRRFEDLGPVEGADDED